MTDVADAAPRTPAQEAPALARIFKNAGSLLGGKAVSGLLSLAYLGIAARTLGPSDMGALVLVHAYAMVIAYIARFQSWQAIIRFGAPMLSDGDERSFRALNRFTIRVDLLSGIATVAVSVACVPIATHFFDWSDKVRSLAYVYCVAIPFMISATPTGVLRLFNRFRLLGLQLTVMPAIRFIGAIAIWLMGGGLEEFIAVWIVSAFADGASLWFLGWRELKLRGLMPKLLGKHDQRANPEWLPFMIKTNLSGTIDLAGSWLPVLIIGAILDSAAAGFLQLAINVTNLLAHPTNMLNQATYPELAREEAENGKRSMMGLALKSTLYAIGAALPVVIAFIFLRQTIAVIVAGEEFRAAAPLIALMAISQPFRIAAVVFESATLARGRAGAALAAQVFSAVAHIGALFGLAGAFGVIGAPIALMLGRAAMIVALAFRALDPFNMMRPGTRASLGLNVGKGK